MVSSHDEGGEKNRLPAEGGGGQPQGETTTLEFSAGTRSLGITHAAWGRTNSLNGIDSCTDSPVHQLANASGCLRVGLSAVGSRRNGMMATARGPERLSVAVRETSVQALEPSGVKVSVV